MIRINLINSQKWTRQKSPAGTNQFIFINLFFALLSSGQLVGYCRLSLMLLIITEVTIDMHTPARKIPMCSHVFFPEENTIAAAPAGG